MLQMGMWDERSLLPFLETTYHRRRVLKSKNKKNNLFIEFSGYVWHCAKAFCVHDE